MIDLLLLGLITVPGCLYVLGAWRRAASRAVSQRGSVRGGGPAVAAFLTGLVVLAVVLSSPMASAADRLLSVHMAQHVVLISVAAPLLAVGRPVVTMLRGLPRNWRVRLVPVRRRLRLILPAPAGPGAVIVAGVVHGLAVAGWHIPAAYDAAVAHPLLHGLEHATFVLTGVALWSVLLESTRRDRYQAVAAVLFASMLESIAIGAALMLSRRLLYLRYAGPDDLTDQQLAGVIMWGYGGLATLIASAWLFMRWLGSGEPGADQRESFEPVPSLPLRSSSSG